MKNPDRSSVTDAYITPSDSLSIKSDEQNKDETVEIFEEKINVSNTIQLPKIDKCQDCFESFKFYNSLDRSKKNSKKIIFFTFPQIFPLPPTL